MGAETECDEERLLHRCIDLDPDGWRELMDRYGRFLSAIIRRILARRGLPSGPTEVDEATEDFFADIFLSKAAALARFRHDGPLRAYLAVLAANHARTRASRLIKERSHADRLADPDNLEEISRSDEVPDSSLTKDSVSEALALCGSDDQALFQLLYVDAVKTEEAASFLGVACEVLYNRKSRLLKKLRTILDRRRVRAESPQPRGSREP